MQSDDPQVLNPKIAAAGIAGGITVILVWALRQFANIEVPGEVASAATTVISGLTGYLKKS